MTEQFAMERKWTTFREGGGKPLEKLVVLGDSSYLDSRPFNHRQEAQTFLEANARTVAFTFSFP